MFKNFLHEIIHKTKKISDEIPVFCIIVDENNNIIAKAKNKVEKHKNPCRHAEIIAIEKALKTLKKRYKTKDQKNPYKYLENCSLYVNLEPCIMCGYAISLARIKNVFFGASDVNFGFFSNKINSTNKQNYFQLMEMECKEIIDEFFKGKR